MDVRKVLDQKYWPIMTQDEKKKALLIEKLGDFPTSEENIAALRDIVERADSAEASFPKIDEFLSEHDLSWEMVG